MLLSFLSFSVLLAVCMRAIRPTFFSPRIRLYLFHTNNTRLEPRRPPAIAPSPLTSTTSRSRDGLPTLGMTPGRLVAQAARNRDASQLASLERGSSVALSLAYHSLLVPYSPKSSLSITVLLWYVNVQFILPFPHH